MRRRLCTDCGGPITHGSIKGRCRACWLKRGPDVPEKTPIIATVCGHPTSRKGNRYCRACWTKRRGDIVAGAASQLPPSGASLSVTGDKAEVGRITPENVRTLADLIRVCEIDTTEWVVERWIANKWEMGSKDTEGNPQTTPLYQIKAWLKRNTPVIDARQEIAHLFADARVKFPARPAVKRRPAGAYVLEIAIPDLHLGKLAWSPETGGPHYDSKLAADVFREALEALIARTAAFHFERVIFPIGNDFFHSDTKLGTTTSGTPLDTDSRFHKTFVVGRRLLTQAIDRLRELAPVEAVIVPGNHDTMAAFHVGDSLSCLYHQTPDVTIQNAPIPRKYVAYGRTLLMFTHGHKGKRQNYPLLMATERPEQFGKARFREAHVGHTHEDRVTESMGVKVRVCPALCPPDAWHSEQHFVGNLRSAEAFVWAKDDGLVSTATYTAPETLEQTA